MNLPISSEPRWIKRKIQKNFGLQDLFIDSIWMERYPLEYYDISWQKFVEAIRDNYYSFIS